MILKLLIIRELGITQAIKQNLNEDYILNEEEIRNYLMSMFNILQTKSSTGLIIASELSDDDQDSGKLTPLRDSISEKRESIKSTNERKFSTRKESIKSTDGVNSSLRKDSIKVQNRKKSSIRKESINLNSKTEVEPDFLKPNNQLVKKSSNETVSGNEIEQEALETATEKEKKKGCIIS